jgi:hypothetical protein
LLEFPHHVIYPLPTGSAALPFPPSLKGSRSDNLLTGITKFGKLLRVV